MSLAQRPRRVKPNPCPAAESWPAWTDEGYWTPTEPAPLLTAAELARIDTAIVKTTRLADEYAARFHAPEPPAAPFEPTEADLAWASLVFHAQDAYDRGLVLPFPTASDPTPAPRFANLEEQLRFDLARQEACAPAGWTDADQLRAFGHV